MRSEILICFALAVMSAFAEPDMKVDWESRNYSFGVLKEEEGVKEGSFRMVNKGEKALVIEKVKTSCGCTQATYPKEAVAPGDTASIHFSYNPAGRPGKFEKSIKIYLTEPGNGESKKPESVMETLTITGKVIPSASTIEKEYPEDLGNGLLCSGKMVNLGDIKWGASRHGFIQLFNTGEKPVRLEFEPETTAMKVESLPDTIQAGENGIISVCLDTSLETRTGELAYSVKIRAAEREGGASKEMKVWANIEKDPAPEIKKGGKYGKTYTQVKKKKTPAEEEASKTNRAFSKKYTEITKH